MAAGVAVDSPAAAVDAAAAAADGAASGDGSHRRYTGGRDCVNPRFESAGSRRFVVHKCAEERHGTGSVIWPAG